jgi:hypothetical protein
VITGAMDGAVRAWSLDGTIRSMLRADGIVASLQVRDQVLVAGTSTGMVYRWPVGALGTPAPSASEPLTPFLAALTDAHLDTSAHLAHR